MNLKNILRQYSRMIHRPSVLVDQALASLCDPSLPRPAGVQPLQVVDNLVREGAQISSQRIVATVPPSGLDEIAGGDPNVRLYASIEGRKERRRAAGSMNRQDGGASQQVDRNPLRKFEQSPQPGSETENRGPDGRMRALPSHAQASSAELGPTSTARFVGR